MIDLLIELNYSYLILLNEDNSVWNQSYLDLLQMYVYSFIQSNINSNAIRKEVKYSLWGFNCNKTSSVKEGI